MAGKFHLFKYEVGDIVTMRKKHPCGSKEWEIKRVGIDVKMICMGCGRDMTMDHATLEKATADVKRDVSANKEDNNG